MSTHIRPEHVSAFEALTSGDFANFALFSCTVNGEPAAAIVAVAPPDEASDLYRIKPLFVCVTPGMALADHDGAAPEVLP